MKIAYFYTEGRKSRLQEENDGEKIPHEFFLGATELDTKHFLVTIFEINDFISVKENRSLFSIYNFCDLSSCSNRIDSNKIKILNEYDLVVASNEFIAFGILDLIKRTVINAPFVFFSMGMLSKTIYNENNSLKQKIKYYIGLNRYKTLLSYAKASIFIGEGEYNVAISKFKEYENKIHFIPFPVDTCFWAPEKAENNYILFIGNDHRRDFELLAKIAHKMPNRQFVFITNRLHKKDLSNNVTMIKGDWRKQFLTDYEIKEYILNSKFAILPLKFTYQPSGQSVAQQCMACGKTVLISKTPGLWEKSLLKNEKNIVLIDSDNEEQWVKEINEMLNNESKSKDIGKNARETMENYFSLENFSKKLTSIFTDSLFFQHNNERC